MIYNLIYFNLWLNKGSTIILFFWGKINYYFACTKLSINVWLQVQLQSLQNLGPIIICITLKWHGECWPLPWVVNGASKVLSLNSCGLKPTKRNHAIKEVKLWGKVGHSSLQSGELIPWLWKQPYPLLFKKMVNITQIFTRAHSTNFTDIINE